MKQFSHRQTRSQNDLALTMLLAGATPEALARLEAASLARSYGVSMVEAEKRLKDARVRRAG